MKTTLSLIKADIGSIGGHIKPSQAVMDAVQDFVEKHKESLVTDFFLSYTGDDIAIFFSHKQGTGSEAIHKLAWDAFVTGTEVAKEQRLYGGGQDLL